MDIGDMGMISVVMGDKKMWTKFKHWLIKKLGGCVAPCAKCNEYEATPLQINRKTVSLSGLVDLNDPNWFNDMSKEERIEHGKDYIFKSMCDFLSDSNNIKYELGDDGILRGTLMVVRQV